MKIRILTFLLCAALTWTAKTSAQTPHTVFLGQLTWVEVRDRVRAGTTTIIIPVGGTEQSGPFLALGKHNARVKALSGLIAARLGNALVAPVLAYVPEGRINPPTSHMRFPGTISIPNRTFESILESAARSFKEHGFRDVVFLGDHGGYQEDLKVVADRLNREWAKTSVRAHDLTTYYRTSQYAFAHLLKQKGFTKEEIGIHAGVLDTSLMLALNPSMVRLHALRSATKISPAEGVYGDPRRATAALGRLGVNLIVSRTVAAIRRAVAHR